MVTSQEEGTLVRCQVFHSNQAGQARQQGLAAALRAWTEWAAQHRAAVQRLAAVHAHWTNVVQRAAFAAWSGRAAWLARKRAAGLRMLQVSAEGCLVNIRTFNMAGAQEVSIPAFQNIFPVA